MALPVREALPGDADAIAALVNRAYRPADGKEGWTHERAIVSGERISGPGVAELIAGPRSAVLVMEKTRSIVACVHVSTPEAEQAKQAHVGLLATDPTLQGAGLGKAMLAAAEHYAIERYNARYCRISVLHTRRELIAFYERRGYQATGETAEYPLYLGAGMPLVDGLHLRMMCKALAP